MNPTSCLLRDLRPMLVLHAALLSCTLLASLLRLFSHDVPLFDSLVGDTKIQIAWLLFLVPGWLLAARWTGRRASFTRRYFAGSVSSIAMHGLLASMCAIFGFSMLAYFAGWAVITGVSLFHRCQQLATRAATTLRPRRMPWMDRALAGSLLLFCIAVYHTPRSNDIRQFVQQQQDMSASLSMQASAIGMTGLGVEEAMPRWKAHLWHLLPSLISVATGVPVDHVLLRYGTIPVAMTVLMCLWFVVVRLTRTQQASWIALAVILGPVLLWYRSFNAFNYSFRLTNNFWLDKDFCLFFLIPAVVYLAGNWLRGMRIYAVPLCLLIPVVLKFHPMTAVYLIGLLPVVAVWKTPRDRQGLHRLTILGFGAAALFAAVLGIGDAQSYHEEIREIVTMDFADHQNATTDHQRRPLHYWTGLYGAIENSGLTMDTTQWSNGEFGLRASIITGCGLLLLSHVCWLIWFILISLGNRPPCSMRHWLGLSLTLMALWTIYVGSRFVLTNSPHLSGGVERLHWFAYLPCLVSIGWTISLTLESIVPNRRHRTVRFTGGFVCLMLLVSSSVFYVAGRATPLNRIRGVNSLLDFDIDYNAERRQYMATKTLDQTLESIRPRYQRDNDVVLLLDIKTKGSYWFVKQGVFWSDSYAEAFALSRRGDDFLEDRKHFYALVDRVPMMTTEKWLSKKRVTLLVDQRPGGDDFLESLVHEMGLPYQRIEPGVWRLQEPKTNS